MSLSFDYDQRHSNEIEAAKKICKAWSVEHATVNLDCLAALTEDVLTHSAKEIGHDEKGRTATLVVGRNGLMIHLG